LKRRDSLFTSVLLAACGGSNGSPSDPAGRGRNAAGSDTGHDVAAAGNSSAGTSAANGGSPARGGQTGGATSSNGAGTSAANGGGGGKHGDGNANAGKSGASAATDHFSFFVTSFAALQRLSGGQQGFGGDLRFNQSDGLTGADEICRQIAEDALPGAGSKVWRAFLSVTKDESGNAVDAIDRVGAGPWYDRLGRVLALDKTDLAQARPVGADAAIIDDFPNEDGVPNHNPDLMKAVDNHDMLTGSDASGRLFSSDWSATCHDWTSSVGADGQPRVGHSWPRSMTSGAGAGAGSGASGSGGGRRGGNGTGPGTNPGAGGDMDNWMSALNEAGCGAGANVVEMGGPNPNVQTVGSGGGYGGFYCFALTP